MIHKILSVGDSAAVTIPRSVLKEIGLKIGDRISLQYDVHEGRIHLVPLSVPRIRVSKKSQQYLEAFFKEYGPALERLARH